MKKASEFAALTTGFILTTIIGTLSHELGHYTVAKLLGYQAEINYAYAWTEPDTGRTVTAHHSFLITLGGPLQTILTGTAGLILLFRCHFPDALKEQKYLTPWHWILIFITLFWLRQPVNFALALIEFIRSGDFPLNSDEVKLALHLHLPYITLSILTALTGTIVFLIVIFRFIPQRLRLVFLISAFCGGISGYILWLHVVGPLVLP